MSLYKLLSIFIMALFLSGCSSKAWDWAFGDDEEEEQIVYEDEAEDFEDDEVIYEYVYEDEMDDEEMSRMDSDDRERRLKYKSDEMDAERKKMRKSRHRGESRGESRHGDEPSYADRGADRGANRSADRSGSSEPRESIIHFDYKKTVPSREGMRILEEHADYLRDNPDAIVTVEGHTDNVAPRDYNKKLGLERAEVVADLLEEMGVDKAQIITVSYGEENPLEEGDSERAHAMNRRVELVY